MMEFSQISVPMVGETANGDRAVVRTEDGGAVLLAVIDGLGHGPGAAAASRLAAECLESISLDTPLADVMEIAHRKMAGSRGAAATVCMIKNRQLEACAVGNVELRTDIRLPFVFSAGILGSQVRRFHVCRASLVSRARLVLFSDGISSRTPIDDMRKLPPRVVCETIMNKYRRKEDDATVLVADIE